MQFRNHVDYKTAFVHDLIEEFQVGTSTLIFMYAS